MAHAGLPMRIGARYAAGPWKFRPLGMRGGSALTPIAIRVSTTSVVSGYDKIHSDAQAEEVVSRLSGNERLLLHAALHASLHGEHRSPLGGTMGGMRSRTVEEQEEGALTQEQAQAVFLVNTLPFIGFGFLDNMIMIMAGEYIEEHIGAWLVLSTMAAAALGNLISDVAGVGLAHYIEKLVGFAGVKQPALTTKQLESGRARMMTNGGRAIGLTIGCLLGMFPLLFSKNDEDKKKEGSK